MGERLIRLLTLAADVFFGACALLLPAVLLALAVAVWFEAADWRAALVVSVVAGFCGAEGAWLIWPEAWREARAWLVRRGER